MSLNFEMKGSLASHHEAKEKEFRDALVEVDIRRGLPVQIREMRESRGWSQGTLGERIGKPQNNISRIENNRDGYLSIKTLLDIASAFDVGLLVKFVPFSEVLRWSDNHTLATVVPPNYDSEIAAEQHEEELARERAAAFLAARNEPNVATFENHLARFLTHEQLDRKPPKRASGVQNEGRGRSESRGIIFLQHGADQRVP